MARLGRAGGARQQQCEDKYDCGCSCRSGVFYERASDCREREREAEENNKNKEEFVFTAIDCMNERTNIFMNEIVVFVFWRRRLCVYVCNGRFNLMNELKVCGGMEG